MSVTSSLAENDDLATFFFLPVSIVCQVPQLFLMTAQIASLVSPITRLCIKHPSTCMRDTGRIRIVAHCINEMSRRPPPSGWDQHMSLRNLRISSSSPACISQTLLHGFLCVNGQSCEGYDSHLWSLWQTIYSSPRSGDRPQWLLSPDNSSPG
ncbi:hypothetical protein BJ166DRAFT_65129 [Pestalotiopsis sp. NC0098]|nr:hypothetical protein BJ166DRAFT_65129 [Pestalotiopsis sp. NC0098]